MQLRWIQLETHVPVLTLLAKSARMIGRRWWAGAIKLRQGKACGEFLRKTQGIDQWRREKRSRARSTDLVYCWNTTAAVISSVNGALSASRCSGVRGVASYCQSRRIWHKELMTVSDEAIHNGFPICSRRCHRIMSSNWGITEQTSIIHSTRKRQVESCGTCWRLILLDITSDMIAKLFGLTFPKEHIESCAALVPFLEWKGKMDTQVMFRNFLGIYGCLWGFCFTFHLGEWFSWLVQCSFVRLEEGLEDIYQIHLSAPLAF